MTHPDPVHTRPRRILVVDDDPFALHSLAVLLRREGFDVGAAEGGAAAMAAAEASMPEIVVTDLQMPELDGMGLMRQLRALDPEMPIIFATASGEVASAVAAIQAGATDYLTKPIAREPLLQAIERAHAAREARARAEHREPLVWTVQRYRNAVELARVPILGIDGDGFVRLFNREAEHVTGVRRDAALGAPLLEVLVQSDPAGHARLQGTFRGVQTEADQARALEALVAPLETEVHESSGQTRRIQWNLTHAALTGDGVVALVIGRDTTDECARTREQQKLAVVGTLAASLAHEIRNPLNGAQLHVAYLKQVLADAEVAADVLDSVGLIADELTRLARLVNDFLGFARPRTLERRTVVLGVLLRRVARLVAPQALAHDVAIDLDLPPSDVEIAADAARLEQVVLNLTQNAIEAIASEARSGRVTYRVRRQPHSVTLDVEDNGPGIPEGTPIFDAFVSTKPQGTGLGLSISAGIVAEHGGKLTVASRPGCTDFRITLPLSDQPAPA